MCEIVDVLKRVTDCWRSWFAPW